MATTNFKTELQASRNMVWLWGQLLMLPLATAVYSMELLLRTMQGMQQVTNQGINVMADPDFGERKPPENSTAAQIQGPGPKAGSLNENGNGTYKEETPLNDNSSYNNCNPNDDRGKCLKLWRYKVLYIKRDLEHAFPEEEDLVTDDVSDITAWKIAEFIQRLGERQIEVPRTWITKMRGPLDYWRIGDADDSPSSYEEALKAHRNGRKIWLVGLPEDDKRFLRLYSQELASYTRERARYDEEQVRVLEQIRDRMPGPAGGGGYGGAGSSGHAGAGGGGHSEGERTGKKTTAGT